MSVLSEQPLIIAAVGALLALTMLWLALSTGRRTWLGGLVAVALVTVVFLWIERRWVTPREEIAVKLAVMARDLESNDVERMVRHIASGQPELVAHVRRLLPKYEIHMAKVKRNLSVQSDGQTPPTSVEARFNAVFRVSERRGDIRNVLSPWYFVVDFTREGSEWKVTGYERRDPRDGFRTSAP